MKKRILTMMILGSMFPLCFAQVKSPLVCPVSGDEASEKASYTYEGKEYHFCCKKCIKKFQKDPQKYIAAMESGDTAASHEHHGMMMHDHGHGDHDD